MHLTPVNLSCGNCNRIKGVSSMADLLARLEQCDGTAPK